MRKKNLLKITTFALTILTLSAVTHVSAAEPEDLSAVSAEGLSDTVSEGSSFHGGYIAMPWDKDVKMTDEDISFSQALEMVVKKDGELDATDYSPRASLPSIYPASDKEAIKTYIQDKYPEIRNQNPFGTCWAFSSVANAEFYAINHNGASKSIDLSEEYLAYGIYKTQTNPVIGNAAAVGGISSDLSDMKLLDMGGNLGFASQFLSKGFGYVNESELPYISSKTDSRFDSSGNLNLDIGELYKKDVTHLKNMYEASINTANGAKIVKEAIMQNGIVGISYRDADTSDGDEYPAETYYDDTNDAYYYDGNKHENTNHAVCVVGWNDDFPASDFNSGHQPENNGAWLVRNSWGADDFYSKNNYFWLSYEDKSIDAAAYIFDVSASADEYDNNYYYDTQIHDSKYIGGKSTVANVFTVQDKGDECLTEVGIEFPGATGYEVSIYTNLKDKSDPYSGSLNESATTSGTIALPGIYTIELREPVVLGEGKDFAVVVTTDACSPAYELGHDNGNGVVINCGIKEGQSFKLGDGKFYDWYGENKGGNFCISAHTLFTDEKVVFKDARGSDVTLTHNLIYDTYKTSDGKDVLVISFEDGSKANTPKYQYTGKKITPSKKAYVVYKGIVYSYKTDYGISFKKNKKRGTAKATVKWKKKSAPYIAGTRKSVMDFSVVERTVTDDMVTVSTKKDKNVIKKISITADGITIKPKKADYSYTVSATDGFTIVFKNNFTGTVTKKA